ncbi:hypothetical protein JYU34_014474 [Plutella xylostella]|uniref:RRM domain-containing protein n=1 Tax=Plutella xylostella TaxID=51655 RepID=A0ABQ7Q8E1_PLUXY|nr:hypothetical protein JYU34_014474 [Plutella xylostella]
MAVPTRLFVGNLPDITVEDDLKTAFGSFGEITNIDLKSKPGDQNKSNKFAFISICASNANIESCIQHFQSVEFKGSKVYVTRARESFLERLQRERQQVQIKEEAKKAPRELPKTNPTIKLNENLNPRKRRLDHPKVHIASPTVVNTEKPVEKHENDHVEVTSDRKKKNDSDKKRLESLKKKRQEFNEKRLIIKTGLVGIDKVANKKTRFSDDEEDYSTVNGNSNTNNKPTNSKCKAQALFDDDDSDNEVNFEIKEQFEGKKGQKVLELQSKFKSDKRFVMDKRFIDNDEDDDDEDQQAAVNGHQEQDDEITVGQSDEKAKQLNILQDVLGIAIKSHSSDPDKEKKKSRSNLGMLRFDPMHPDHAKFLAPVEEQKQDLTKKSKKKKNKGEETEETPQPEPEKIEVSKEQFYTVTDTLKEAIKQPNTFSLRSLFKTSEQEDGSTDKQDQEDGYTPLEKKKESKIKNPLEPGERNPFQYDSSDSEPEDEVEKSDTKPEQSQDVKAVWKEDFFFSPNDKRLEEGVAFFLNSSGNEVQKDRRELKTLMKKRLYKKDRREQSQMFKKKIGGKRNSNNKNFRRKT